MRPHGLHGWAGGAGALAWRERGHSRGRTALPTRPGPPTHAPGRKAQGEGQAARMLPRARGGAHPSGCPRASLPEGLGLRGWAETKGRARRAASRGSDCGNLPRPHCLPVSPARPCPPLPGAAGRRTLGSKPDTGPPRTAWGGQGRWLVRCCGYPPMASPCSETMEAKSLMIWFTSNRSLCGRKRTAVRSLEPTVHKSRPYPSAVLTAKNQKRAQGHPSTQRHCWDLKHCPPTQRSKPTLSIPGP